MHIRATGINDGPEKPSEKIKIDFRLPEASSFRSKAQWRVINRLKKQYLKHINWPSRVGAGLIDLYGATLGVILGGQCRFYPSCSSYARQAVLKHGLLRGSLKSIWRILRCNPLNPGGVDEP